MHRQLSALFPAIVKKAFVWVVSKRNREAGQRHSAGRGGVVSALVLAFMVVACLSVLRTAEPQILQNLRLWAFDSFQRLEPRAYGGAPAVVVDIDNESLERVGQWPWSRGLIARMVQRLEQAGVAVVAFDIVFAEPDRSAPASVIEDWRQSLSGDIDLPLTQFQEDYLETIANPDRQLAAALAATRTVTGFALTGQATGGRTPDRVAGFAWGGSHPAAVINNYDGAIANLELLEAAAAGNGDFSLRNDADNIVRRAPLLQALNGEIYPSLTAEALRVATGTSSYIVRSSDASGEVGQPLTGVTTVKIGPYEVPTTAKGEIWMHYRPLTEDDRMAAWKLLDENISLEEIAQAFGGRIALFGVSATGLLDIRATPLNPALPGVFVHAQAIEQIIHQDYLLRPDWAPGAEWLLMAALALGLAAALARLSSLGGALAGLSALTLAGAFSWFAFSWEGLLIDPVLPVAASLTTFLAVSVYRHFTVERRRSSLKKVFAQYLSPALVDKLAERPEQVKLGGETREMTLLFSDIRGFTSLSERMRPDELSILMNRYLTTMSKAILETGGTIDKYIGDAVMAFWNAPLADPEHPASAARAALAMREALRLLNEEELQQAEREKREPRLIKMGVGLNTGPAAVGNFGSEQRFAYTALGDTVNLASRIESLTKSYAVDILVSETTREALTDHAILEVDKVQARGREGKTTLYLLVGTPELATSAPFLLLKESHDRLLKLIADGDWPAAEQALIEARLRAGPQLKDFYQRYHDIIAERRRAQEEAIVAGDYRRMMSDGVYLDPRLSTVQKEKVSGQE